ncbi:hypothetical protein [Clostridium sp.]|uniref:hypothetical protein n=1 Tax=Clostridium sp. TaxID=1506 RepID=UPI00262278BD|nr:hypothetical protein [Clostridium sp.]
MAWYYGTFSCGHEGRVNIIGPTKDRQWKADKRFSGMCEECYLKHLEEENERKNKEALAAAKEMELPNLTGTEKQITWANTIRVELIEKLQKEIDKILKDKRLDYNSEEYFRYQYKDITIKDFISNINEIVDYMIQHKTEAKWYIDNRSKKTILLIDLFSEIRTNKLLEKEKVQMKEVIQEGTIAPKEVKFIGIVQIGATKEKITAKYEKNDTFRDIVKNLNLKWEETKWERKLSELTGLYIDRAAELGNKLLNAGFNICILDEEIREKAVNGAYELECERWIKYDKDSKKLAIRWYDKNDYMYDAARKIKTSKWKSEIKSVIVDISHHEEVKEFAELYKCKFTEEALSYIEQYKTELANIPKVEPIKTKDNIKEDGLQNILNSSREILDDLREDD